MGLIEKIKGASRNRTTYQVGLLQTRAYRILKQLTAAALAPQGITSVHWAFLGLLFDEEKGMRPADIAKLLIVEAPFVTQMASELKEKGLMESISDPTDTRAKILRLTKAGKIFVKDIEPRLRREMKPIIAGVSLSDLMSYISVLEAMVENFTSKD